MLTWSYDGTSTLTVTKDGLVDGGHYLLSAHDPNSSAVFGTASGGSVTLTLTDIGGASSGDTFGWFLAYDPRVVIYSTPEIATNVFKIGTSTTTGESFTAAWDYNGSTNLAVTITAVADVTYVVQARAGAGGVSSSTFGPFTGGSSQTLNLTLVFVDTGRNFAGILYNNAAPNVEYSTRLFVGNTSSGGTAGNPGGGADPTPPTVVSESATPQSPPNAASVTIGATINPNGTSTQWRVQYGPTNAYGTTTSLLTVGSGFGSVDVSRDLTLLTGSTLYHYRVVAVNSNGDIVNGADDTFTTGITDKPDIRNQTAVAVTDTTATIDFQIRPNGLTATYWAATTIPVAVESPHATDGSGSAWVDVESVIAGLTPNTLYNYRVLAQNANGSSFTGATLTFRTLLPAAFGGGCPVLIEDFNHADCNLPGLTVKGDGIRVKGNQGAGLHTEDTAHASTFGASTYGTVDIYMTLTVVGGKQDVGWTGGTVGAPDGYVARSDAGAGTAEVVRLDAGVETVLATVAAVFADGDKLGYRYQAGPNEISVWQYTAGTWTQLASATDATYATGAAYVGLGNTPFDTAVPTADLFDLSTYGTMGGGDKYTWSQSRWRIFKGALGQNLYPNPAGNCPIWALQLTVFPHGVFDYGNDAWSKGGGHPGGGNIFSTEVWPYEPITGALWDPTFNCFDGLQSFFVADSDFTFKCYAAINTSMSNVLGIYGTSFLGTIPAGHSYVDDCGTTVNPDDSHQVFMPVVVNPPRVDDLYMGGTCAPTRVFKPQIVRYR